MKGYVKFFNASRGFGFIKADDGTEYFFHQTGLGPGVLVQQNDKVDFEVEQGDRGPKAKNITISTG